jgi:predicted hotdog family 3-hydroxylacyl-ACP dehydratase
VRLDRAWIERHIPHRGEMCLLDEVIEWDVLQIRCRTATHRGRDHPLRSMGRLGAACGIEYAAQTMAVHGALTGGAANSGTSEDAAVGRGPQVGFLVGLRDVRLHVLRLDDIEGDLVCEATRLAGNPQSALYEFSLWSQMRTLLRGRATVVLDADKMMKI